jgi:hypothetical protein
MVRKLQLHRIIVYNMQTKDGVLGLKTNWHQSKREINNKQKDQVWQLGHGQLAVLEQTGGRWCE